MKIILSKLFVILTLTVMYGGLLNLISCSAPQKTQIEQEKTVIKPDGLKNYKKLAVEKYSGDFMYVPNSTGKYMLCISHSKPTNENSIPTLNYFIFNLSNELIMHEDSCVNCNVNWKNDYQIMIHTFPEKINIANVQPVIYIYDIKKNRKFIDEIIDNK